MKFVSALNRKLFHISDHRVVRQLVESLTEIALKLIMHETSIRDLVEKVPVVRLAYITGTKFLGDSVHQSESEICKQRTDRTSVLTVPLRRSVIPPKFHWHRCHCFPRHSSPEDHEV